MKYTVSETVAYVFVYNTDYPTVDALKLCALFMNVCVCVREGVYIFTVC